MTDYILEPQQITDYKVHEGSDIIFLVKSGSVVFETVYLNLKEVVVKHTNESYQIKEKVKYRLHNTCNLPCNIVIITEA